MRTPIASYCLFAVLLATSTCSFAAESKQYNALIKKAQAGDYEPALIMLRERGQNQPSDLRAVYDHIIIANWAGNADEVLEVYGTLPPSRKGLPAEVQSAVARAYRDTKQFDHALALYRDGARRFPKNPSFALAETMVLAEAGHPDEALALGESLVKSGPTQPDRRLALSYVYRIKQQPYAALQEAATAHRLAPNKPYVTREYIYALQHAQLSEAALRTAKLHPNLMTASEMRRLEADYAAELSRLAAMPSRLEAERFFIADRALAQYDRLIPAWQALGPPAKDDLLRIRLDRIQALHARARMQDVVSEYEWLRAQGRPIPHYVLNDVASAYLELRQPEIARDLYRQIIANEATQHDEAGEQFSNETGLFYSLIESEDFRDADRVVAQAQKNQPTWRYIKGVPMRIPNDLHMYAEQTAALSQLYSDDTVRAQQEMESLVAQGPRTVGLRASLASVYRARNWPRLSERQLKMAETLEPNSSDVIGGQGLTAMDLQEWRQAKLLTADVRTRFPEDSTTQNLVREWEVHKKAELRVSGSRGISSNSPVSGSGDFGVDTVLYSPPISDNWRVFGGGGYAYGKFEEGTGTYRWLRTGAEWRGRDLTAEIEASTHNYSFGTKPGARVTAAYDVNDQWQLGASAELRSRDTPLRALTNGIYANSLGAFVRWRANERREWTFSLAPSRFSDGNKRLAAAISGRERLYTSPKLKADLEVNISASRNTRENVPYFNPRSDLEVLPAVTLTHVIYRRYDTALEQKFILGAGTYTQRGYGTSAIGALGYGMRYRFNQVFELGATATGVNRQYDGIRERDIQIMFDMSFRF